jgi:hypothetical protein
VCQNLKKVWQIVCTIGGKNLIDWNNGMMEKWYNTNVNSNPPTGGPKSII